MPKTKTAYKYKTVLVLFVMPDFSHGAPVSYMLKAFPRRKRPAHKEKQAVAAAAAAAADAPAAATVAATIAQGDRRPG